MISSIVTSSKDCACTSCRAASSRRAFPPSLSGFPCCPATLSYFPKQPYTTKFTTIQYKSFYQYSQVRGKIQGKKQVISPFLLFTLSIAIFSLMLPISKSVLRTGIYVNVLFFLQELGTLNTHPGEISHK